jgi:hypothetical protein
MDMNDLLQKYNNFDECVILEVRLRDYQTTLELFINHIWDDEGNIRPNIDELRVVVVRFQLVQEVLIRNNLNSAKLLEPERMNWGMNAIALIRIEEQESKLASYRGLPVSFHHAAIMWENERRIDVVFAHLEIEEIEGATENWKIF